MLEAFNAKIQSADFLTNDERAEALDKNKAYIENYYVPAYQYLADELGKLEAQPKLLAYIAARTAFSIMRT